MATKLENAMKIAASNTLLNFMGNNLFNDDNHQSKINIAFDSLNKINETSYQAAFNLTKINKLQVRMPISLSQIEDIEELVKKYGRNTSEQTGPRFLPHYNKLPEKLLTLTVDVIVNGQVLLDCEYADDQLVFKAINMPFVDEGKKLSLSVHSAALGTRGFREFNGQTPFYAYIENDLHQCVLEWFKTRIRLKKSKFPPVPLAELKTLELNESDEKLIRGLIDNPFRFKINMKLLEVMLDRHQRALSRRFYRTNDKDRELYAEQGYISIRSFQEKLFEMLSHFDDDSLTSTGLILSKMQNIEVSQVLKKTVPVATHTVSELIGNMKNSLALLDQDMLNENKIEALQEKIQQRLKINIELLETCISNLKAAEYTLTEALSE